MRETEDRFNPAHLQLDCDVRVEWGVHGAQVVAQPDDVAVIVDVLSFSTALEMACARDAVVFPFRFNDSRAASFAASSSAHLAVHRGQQGYSLSPQSVAAIPHGTRLVLPSPNGSTLTLECRASRIAAGCLRNAAAVARWAAQTGGTITVVAAGERWPDGSLRPAIEDLIGAGAIISCLSGRKSPEAQIAEAVWHAVSGRLEQQLNACASGLELIHRGYRDDVRLAAQLNCSTCVPVFVDGCYRRC